MKTLKEINKELMNELKKHYRSGRMVCYKGYEENSHVIVKPFKRSDMEFAIHLAKGIRCILRSRHFNDPYDHDCGTDPDMKVYELHKCGSLEKGFNFEVIFDVLKKAIDKYVEEERDFYNEGLEIHREWSRDEKEVKKLAGIPYREGFLKELGIER